MKTPTLLQQDRVKVVEVISARRLRPVTPAGVASLIASIGETGVMKDAIHVRKKRDGKLHLIAGAHRLEAARQLGWDEIEAKVWADATDEWARLLEIDDNLAGAEMNVLDTAIFLAERKRLYENLHPESRQASGAALVARRWDTADMMSVVSFAAATAEKFGITDRHVRRLVAAGDALTHDEVRWLRAAPSPVSLADLQSLSKIGDQRERSQICIVLSNGSARSVSQALKARQAGDGADADAIEGPFEKSFKALLDAWDRAPMATRKRFLLERAREVWEAQNKGPALTDWQDAAE